MNNKLLRIIIKKGEADKISVSFPYDRALLQKIKTIEGHRWHPEGKCWSCPNTNGTLQKILKVFEGEEKALNVLRQYWTEYKPQKWLFEGTKPERHISVRTVQKIFEHACTIVGAKKDITVYTLRHSFATKVELI